MAVHVQELWFLLLTLVLIFNVSGFQLRKLNNLPFYRSCKLYDANKPPRKAPADDNFISNFFSKFLPTPEELGLSRFDSNSRPENYLCTKTEWASLLPEDLNSKDSELILIRQTLAKTNLEFRPLQCVYDANKDGWKAKVLIYTVNIFAIGFKQHVYPLIIGIP